MRTQVLEVEWGIPPLLQSAPLSKINKDAKGVEDQLENGPVHIIKNSATFGVIVNAEGWNRIANAMAKIDDLLEINELLQLEIERLKAGEAETEPWDIDELKQDAGRV